METPDEKKAQVTGPYSYADIYADVQRYASSKNAGETLAVILDRKSIDAIQQHGDRIAAVLAKHDNGTVTICLLALEAGTNKVSSRHVSGGVPGQQVWPTVTVSEFNSLMEQPK